MTTPLLFSIAQCTGSTPVPATKISASRFDPSVILPAREMEEKENNFICRKKKREIEKKNRALQRDFLSLYFIINLLIEVIHPSEKLSLWQRT